LGALAPQDNHQRTTPTYVGGSNPGLAAFNQSNSAIEPMEWRYGNVANATGSGIASTLQ
jgi:hypothetical protein